MDRFLHIKSSNKYLKTKTTERGNEPKKKKKKRAKKKREKNLDH